MREILFRGNQVNDGMWIQGYLFQCWGRAYILWGMTNDTPTMHEVKPETVGQFTGLLDKHGRKIFEGDIVVLSDDTVLPGYRYAISFHDGAFCIGLHDGELFGDFCSIRDGMAQARKYDKEFSICVVGTIHDNPKLLT